jgi:hypothetical protein
MKARTKAVNLMAIVLAVLLAMATGASADTCDKGSDELEVRIARIAILRVQGRPQREIDEAVFEALRRGILVTGCPGASRRAEALGRQLLDLDPAEYATAILQMLVDESLRTEAEREGVR